MVSNDRGHDARYQRVVDAIDEYGPNDAWKQRAKVITSRHTTIAQR